MDQTSIDFWRGQTTAQINAALQASVAGTAPLPPAALQALLLSRSVDIGNAGAAILYSNVVGGVPAFQLAEDLSAGSVRPDGTREIAVFSQTEMGQIRNSQLFTDAVDRAHGFDAAAIDTFFGVGPTPGLDDAMSRAYVANLDVPVITVTGPDANVGRVFGRTEVPAILDNPNIPSVDGISRADLVQRFQGSELVGRDGVTDVFEMIKARSFDNMVESGASIGRDAAGTARFAPNADFLDRAGAPDLTPHASLPDVPSGAGSFGALSDDALSALGRGARYLDFLGTVGDVLEGVLVLNTARELIQAGDEAGAAQAIAEWAGSLAGGTLAVSLVAPLAAGLAATGVGAIGSVALLVAAGVVGSIAGEQAVKALIDNLDEIGAFFGEAYDNIADFVANGGAAAENFINGLVDYAVDVSDRIGEFGSELVGDALGTITDFLQDVGQAVSELGGDVGDVINGIGDAIEGIAEALGDAIGDAANWFDGLIDPFTDALANLFIRNIDPIILDLDGDGVEFVSAANINIFFDMDGDGRRERTGWILPDDGFLALDANRNGRVDDIEELFGRDGQSGFAELLTLDTNNDKVLNSLDAQWNRLSIWRDLNQNGVGDAGELTTLRSWNVASIDLNFITVNTNAQGNLVHEASTYTLNNGTVRSIVDGWLSVNGALTAYEKSDGVPADIAALPDLRGSGNVANLRVAAATDAQLKTTLQVFNALSPTSIGAWPALIDEIIYRWADVFGVSPTSRGPNFDGRKLEAIEEFLGREFSRNGLRDPVPQTVPDLNETWALLHRKVAAALLAQGPLNDLLEATLVVPSTGELLSGLTLQDQSAQLVGKLADLSPREAAQLLSAYRIVAEEIGAGDGLTPAAIGQQFRVALVPLGLGAFQAAVEAGTRIGASNIAGAPAMHLFTGAADIVTVSGRQVVFGGGGNDLVQTAGTDGANAKFLSGEAGSDTLYGGQDNDVLDGGAGADLMLGGTGNDLYRVDSVADRIIELPNSGEDTIEASVAINIPDHFEAILFTGSRAVSASGNALGNLMRGTAAADQLFGLGGDDRLDGGAGADTLTGGEGNDTYVLDDIADVVRETRFRHGVDTVEVGFTYTLGRLLENLVLTGMADTNGTGNGLGNAITGNAGNNLLDGGGGNDSMAGGLGDDVYIVDSGGDTVTEAVNAGNDTVRSAVTFSLGIHVEALILTGTADINGTGNAQANLLRGNAGANLLDGGLGQDTMEGGDGDDTYVVDDLGDVVTEANNGGSDTVRAGVTYVLGNPLEGLLLTGNLAIDGTGNGRDNVITGNGAVNFLAGLGGNDSIAGGGGNDALSGGAGNDTLDGGTGSDTMTGGDGDDVYIVGTVDDAVSEASGEGRDRVLAAVSWALGANFEELELTGGGSLEGRGNALANLLIGGTGPNLLDGAAGRDTMVGGTGNDTYMVDDAGDVTDETFGNGIDSVIAGITWVLGFGLENLTLTGTATAGTGNDLDNVILGNAAANTLTGFGGNDKLDGGAGNDTLLGGAGNDTYVLDSASDVVREVSSRDGIDTVEVSESYVLGRFIENLILTGAGAINGTGNDLANSMVGNAASNLLDGGRGADTMAAGLGDDTYIVDSNSDRVTEDQNGGSDTVRSAVNFLLPNNVEALILTGSADVNGTGNTQGNRIVGNAGANLLDGGLGNDTMEGGDGDDTYIVDVADDVLIEGANGGFDLVRTGISFTLGTGFEALALTGASALNGTGNAAVNEIVGNTAANLLRGLDGDDSLDGGAGNDTLEGGAGNDTLQGGAGNDQMAGGLGDDVYFLNSADDVVLEVANGGVDTLYLNFGLLLDPEIENAILTGGASADLQGNGADNLLMGNDAANVLTGGGGKDLMIGLGGNDTYEVLEAGDLVVEQFGGGIDLVRSAISYLLSPYIENLTLIGSANIDATGNDLGNVLQGNAGDNALVGLLGADQLEGRAGADRFVYRAAAESGTANGAADTILDFDQSAGDRIDVSAIDANAGVDGDQAFVFIGSAGFTAAGQIRMTVEATRRVLNLNLDAQLGSDMTIVLQGTAALTQDAFIL